MLEKFGLIKCLTSNDTKIHVVGLSFNWHVKLK